MKIIIVDDEYFAIQGMLRGVDWAALGFEPPLTAGNYDEAVEQLAATPVDVALCDVEMPHKSGLELIAWINGHCPDTVCIVLTCHDEFSFAQTAVKLNCLDYILKPTPYDQLTEVLQRAVDTVRQRRHQAMIAGYGEQYISSLAEDVSAPRADPLKEAVNYIHAHLADDLSVTLLASVAHINPDYLSRLFKRQYQMTINNYILEKRMELAGELLKKPDMTVTQVSSAVGFSNYSYFSVQFRKIYNMAPRDYQNLHQKDGAP